MKKLLIALLMLMLPVTLIVAQDEVEERDAQVVEIYDSLEQEIIYLNDLMYFYLPADYTANVDDTQAIVFGNEETAVYYMQLLDAIKLSLEDPEAGEAARAEIVMPETANLITLRADSNTNLAVTSMEEYLMNQVKSAQESAGYEFEVVGPLEAEIAGYPGMYMYWNVSASDVMKMEMPADLVASQFIGVFEIDSAYFITTQISIGAEDLTPIGEAIYYSQWIDEDVLAAMKANQGS